MNSVKDDDTPIPPLGPVEKSNLLTFEGESLAQINAKLLVADTFLKFLNRDWTFPEYVREILLTLMKVIGSEAGSILEVDEDRKLLFFRAGVGSRSAELEKFTVPFGHGIAGFVAESQQPLLVPVMNENELALKSIQNAVGFVPKNLIAVPILIRGKTFGVIELLNRTGEESYTATDLELLTYFAALAGSIIEVRLMMSWYAKQLNNLDPHRSKAA